MKKLKSIMAFILASGLCSVMTACGDSAENSNSEPESSVSVSSAEESSADENSVDESSEEPTTEEATTTEEVTTTEETTTEEPTTEAKKEFTPLVADGESVNCDILEQVIPSIYGMPIDEAAEAIMTAFNFRTDNKEVFDTPAEEMVYTIPEDYNGRITYRYDVSNCNLIVFDNKCEELIINAYYNDDSGYTFGFGFFFTDDLTSNSVSELAIQLFEYYEGHNYGYHRFTEWQDFSYKDTYIGNISISYLGENSLYVFIENNMAPDNYEN
ncbi:MAG: hypothetical protein NC340_08120 [Ruminococcus flavefaciens]|nr:hypothetical protein [Ruminococcus flavefaciens]MCM1229666.1 hypothetical protein [Ruminococcus flavefaciens]